MFNIRADDTIVAISTPPGPGGLGILRLSGPRAPAIAAEIFRAKSGRSAGFPERKVVFGSLLDPVSKEIVDEGFLTFFPAPRSYTRQDVVELSLHGSPAVLDEGVRLAVNAGARRAEAGEFTLRAYWNGRIDILQAEALNDLIQSVTPAQARIASRQARGELTSRVQILRTTFIEILADLEAAIEFPDERLAVTERTVIKRLERFVPWLDDLIRSYDAGKAVFEGLTLALVGRTNVGKSTLFNALLGKQRAIVAPQAGTTRDYLQETIRIGDARFNLIDMAGLGKAAGGAEKEGIRRAHELAAAADGILFIIDFSRDAGPGDLRLLEEFSGKKSILVYNKSDRPRRIRPAALKHRAAGMPALQVSALNGDNIPALRTLIRRTFVRQDRRNGEIVLHLRQKVVLEEILTKIRKALEAAATETAVELLAEDIRQVIPAIERLTGEVRAADVVENIFKRFCVGK